MVRITLCLLLFIFLSRVSYSQRVTVNGYVRDANGGESLIGASVVSGTSGTAVNAHGFYSLTLASDSVSIRYSYIGYSSLTVVFKLHRDTTINITLQSSSELSEVVISSTRVEPIQESSRMGSVTIPVGQIKALPAFAGETDILKIIQLLPGVQSGNEGTTGLYVRGGGPDQNLMLLDGVPIYNASHLFGFFSVFNADAINHVELTKGGFPARYGGRLSSVLDINMKEGNMDKLHGEGSIGLIASRATVEGPVKKGKSSFIVSARRSYIDLLARPLIKVLSGNTAGYYLFDVNLKYNHILNRNNRIYLSSYFGKDNGILKVKDYTIVRNERVDNQSVNEIKWGNAIAAARWNHIFTPRIFSNMLLTFSNYNFSLNQKYEEKSTGTFYGTRYQSGIQDWAAKIDFEYYPNPNHAIRFGTNHIAHKFTPGAARFKSSEGDTLTGARLVYAYVGSAYVEDDWRLSDKLKVNVGLHTSAFAVENRWYHSFQPRLSTRFSLTSKMSLKASYSRMTQFIHLLTNAGIGLPTDLWVPSTAAVRPQEADQYSIGFAKQHRNQYEFSIEGFYKKMNNLIEYKDGASFLDTSTDWQKKVAAGGHGKSYGLELFLQKKTGIVTGWVGYTLSKTVRQFDELNFGREFPYKYDRRHDISLALAHEWNKRMDFSASWVYGTGNSVTLPTASYSGADNRLSYSTRPGPFAPGSPQVYDYGDRNSFRMRAYHRLDLSFSWWKDTKWGQRKWTLSLYNVYSRRNPFYMNISRDKQGNLAYTQTSLFPIIPSIAYGFKF